MWRLDHQVELPKMKMVARVSGPFPDLWHLAFPRSGRINDVSAKDWVEPTWMRMTGKEVTPFGIGVAGPITLSMFLTYYALDAADTTLRRLVHRFLPWRRKGAAPLGAAAPPAPVAPAPAAEPAPLRIAGTVPAAPAAARVTVAPLEVAAGD